jgi:dihydrofolate reductase
MTRVCASITTSVDGYVTGPDDGPGKGLGEGGERRHYWVFGGPWTYESEAKGEPGAGLDGVAKEWMDAAFARLGACVVGRNMYEAAGHWGDRNPWHVPTFIVTHRPEEQPDGDEFVFVDGLAEAVERAKAAAGDKDVSLSGGADVIRQALAAGLVDELSIVVAPVILGRGKLLFEGFDHDIELTPKGVQQSPLATFIDYEVAKP